MKSIADDLVVTCDEIVDTPESVPSNLSDGIGYWLIAVVLVSIACSLMFVATVVYKRWINNSIIIIVLVCNF